LFFYRSKYFNKKMNNLEQKQKAVFDANRRINQIIQTNINNQYLQNIRALSRTEIQNHANELVRELEQAAFSYYQISHNIENRLDYQEFDMITTERVRKVNEALNSIREGSQQHHNLAVHNIEIKDLVERFNRELNMNGITNMSRKLIYLIRSRAHDILEKEIRILRDNFDFNFPIGRDEENVFQEDVELLTENLLQNIQVVRNGILLPNANQPAKIQNHVNPEQNAALDSMSTNMLSESNNFKRIIENSELNQRTLRYLNEFYDKCIIILNEVLTRMRRVFN
jgi:hypothetical protein